MTNEDFLEDTTMHRRQQPNYGPNNRHHPERKKLRWSVVCACAMFIAGGLALCRGAW